MRPGLYKHRNSEDVDWHLLRAESRPYGLRVLIQPVYNHTHPDLSGLPLEEPFWGTIRFGMERNWTLVDDEADSF